MSERVKMPALGESVTEGTVTRWLKGVGDSVEVDEPLLEVSTDKVDTEIPSPVAGTLQEILVQEDDTVPVGADLAVIGDGAAPAGGDSGGEQSSTDAADEQAPAPATRCPTSPTATPWRRPATRVARSPPSRRREAPRQPTEAARAAAGAAGRRSRPPRHPATPVGPATAPR